MRSRRDFHATWCRGASSWGDASVLGHEPLSHLYGVDEPEVELVEKNDAYWLIAELAGMHQDDITVRVDANILTLQGEWPKAEPTQGGATLVRPCRSFARRFVLEEPVEPDAISVTYVDGALAVCIRKMVRSQTEPSLARTA
jgi:HSP20 family molecular chaperone IbpA